MGVFADHAPGYLAHGIPVFPTGGDNGKKALVKNYQHMGVPASRKLLEGARFDTANLAFMCGRRNRITVLDVDTPDRTAFDRAVKECGPTPVLIQTGSGKYQAWYRHNGEKRKIRPIEGEAIDVLGGGMVIAPPSIRPDLDGKAYRFLDGSLDDVNRLPAIRKGSLPPEIYGPRGKSDNQNSGMLQGRRDDELFKQCLRDLANGHDPEKMPSRALVWNEGCNPPQTEAEVMATVASAIKVHLEKRNWVGSRGIFQVTRADLEAFGGDADALLLFGVLGFEHGSRKEPFAISPIGMETGNVIPGWGKKRYRNARNHLEEMGLISCVHKGTGRGNPSLFLLSAKVSPKEPQYNRTCSPPLEGNGT
ncbi:MAG: bifunctional DNA primase/polymerase [Proteobacteria bacterium]|nr:bifunctional DNA primase/polymerase [Pseudomonadota bacterium]